MKEFEFFVEGVPQPNAKVDAVKRFRKGDRKNTPTGLGTKKRDPNGLIAAWTSKIQRVARAYMALEDRQPFEKGEPLEVVCQFWVPQAKANKTKFNVQKPDNSNYYYLPENALEGICYHNDEQIVDLRSKKKWEFHESKKHTRGVWITIERVKEDWK